MGDFDRDAPLLVLGPMLRYIGETAVTIWVETDRACQVEILGRRARTFEVAGHHYGLVVIDGLSPGGEREYRSPWTVPSAGRNQVRSSRRACSGPWTRPGRCG